jgi:hypothetical protein
MAKKFVYPSLKKETQTTISLTEEHKSLLKSLGQGKVSDGVRVILHTFEAEIKKEIRRLKST